MRWSLIKRGGGMKWRIWWTGGLVVLLSMLVVGELFCRVCLKLGDPPLFMTDPEIGYLSRPNQNCHRFGNLVHFNAYSMRSDDFPMHKASTNELRIMVIGDSVIFAGARTDQRLMGTSLIKQELPGRLNRPVEVGNISCNGWEPVNEWPYIRRHGLFDADIFIMELRSGSVHTLNTNALVDVDPNFPSHKPWCATWEAVTRYLPKVCPALFPKPSNEGYHDTVDDPGVFEANMAAVTNMINAAKAAGATPYVILHWIRPELSQAQKEPGWRPKGFQEIEATAARFGVGVWDMHDVEARDVGHIYRDNYHLNDDGQRDFADFIENALVRRYAPQKP